MSAAQAIYGHPEEFGGTLFSHAVSVMTDLIHHEPQSFRQLQEAGLPDAFLAAVKVRIEDKHLSVLHRLLAACSASVAAMQSAYGADFRLERCSLRNVLTLL